MATTNRDELGALVSRGRHVETGTVSLQSGDDAVLGSYPVGPCRHAGIDPEDPGVYNWTYDRQEQVLIIDLGTDIDESE